MVDSASESRHVTVDSAAKLQKKKTYTKYKQSLKELTSHKYNRTSIAQEYDAGIQIYFLAIII